MTNNPTPSQVCYTMRRLLKDKVSSYNLDRTALKYITDHDLIVEVRWPATFLKITEAGYQYLIENEPSED